VASAGPYANHLHLAPDRYHASTSPLSFYRPYVLPVAQPTASKHWRQIFVYPIHWIDPQISFFHLSVSLCVCEQIGCQMITSTILYRFSQNFACGSEMWLLHRLLFVRQTRSSLPILEVCGFRFWQLPGSDDHIFQHISTKSHIQIKIQQCRLCIQWRMKLEIKIGF